MLLAIQYLVLRAPCVQTHIAGGVGCKCTSFVFVGLTDIEPSKNMTHGLSCINESTNHQSIMMRVKYKEYVYVQFHDNII